MSALDGHGEFERQILSCSLQGEDLSRFVSLPPNAWSTAQHRDIAQAVSSVYFAGEVVDEVGVFKQLTKMDCSHTTLDDLFNLTTSWSTYGQLPRLCDQLAEQASHRRVIQTIQQAVSIAMDADDAQSAKQSALGKILSLSDVESAQHLFPMKAGLGEVISQTREAFALPPEQKAKPKGIPTGLRGLDEILGGFRPGSLYVLGAGTGRGKSVMGLQFALGAAEAGAAPLYVSLEMSHVDLCRRMVSSKSRTSPQVIESGCLNESQIDGLTAAVNQLNRLSESFTIYDQPSLTLYQLAATVRQLSQQGAVDIVVVDYLQLLRTDETYSREREVATISAGLVAIARTNNVPVIALSQLNDNGQVRESRAVSHDAAGVLRIDYEDGHWVEGSEPLPCSIGVLKHRHGRTGRIPLTFERAYQRFVERAY